MIWEKLEARSRRFKVGAAARRGAALPLAAALIFGAAAPAAGEAGTGPKRASDPAYGTTFPARVLRKDRLILGPETRICIATTVDPEARRIVEASGDRLDPEAAKGITYFTSTRLTAEFRDRRWIDGPRDRILNYIEHERDPKACFERSDTILVRHSVARGKSARGYAVRLTAIQGRRVYEVAVERPYAVWVSKEIRGAIDYRSNHVPWSKQLYWDPLRDSNKMTDLFIGHLLEGRPAYG
jgi:hypothetical protein